MLQAVSTKEIDELHILARRIWMEHFTKFLPLRMVYRVFNTFQSVEAIKTQMEEGYTYNFITFKDERVGYSAIRLEGDSLFISKIYVLKDMRGNGIGRSTLEAYKDIASCLGMRRLYLHVNKLNRPSIEMYKHCGFTVCDELKTDLGDGFIMDDYVMELVI